MREYSESSVVLDDKARVLQVLLAAHAFQVALPALAVGRIGEHEVELAGAEGVVGQRGVGRSADDVVRRVAVAFEQEVGLADGVGLGVDLLAVKVGGDLLAVGLGDFLQRFLADGQHAAGAAGAVVEQIGAGFDLVGHGQEHEIGHQLDGIAGRPVLAGLFVVVLVEAADEFLEHRAHGVVVEAGQVADRVGAEVDVLVEELLDELAERIGLGEAGNLVAELEVVEDVLHVRREAVEVGLEVVLELLLGGAGLQVAQQKGRGVVEGLAGGGAEGVVLIGDLLPVERGLHVAARPAWSAPARHRGGAGRSSAG